MEQRRLPAPGEFYRHFKNKMYQIVAGASHSETGEAMVVYQALYGDFKIWVRPLSMFMEEVDREKYPDVEQEYRFEQVFPGQMNELGKNGNKPATGNLAEYDQTQQPEEQMSHEWLERFLDADRPEDQLAVLKQMEGHVTQKELDCIFLSLDLQPETEKTKTEQVMDLRRHIQLLRRYDGSRLR